MWYTQSLGIVASEKGSRNLHSSVICPHWCLVKSPLNHKLLLGFCTPCHWSSVMTVIGEMWNSIWSQELLVLFDLLLISQIWIKNINEIINSVKIDSIVSLCLAKHCCKHLIKMFYLSFNTVLLWRSFNIFPTFAIAQLVLCSNFNQLQLQAEVHEQNRRAAAWNWCEEQLARCQ